MKPSKGKERLVKKAGRPPRIEVVAGMVFGYLRVLKKIKDDRSGNTWQCKCIAPSGPNGNACNLVLPVRQHYLLRQPNPKTSCGCMTYIGTNPHKREKVIWQMMNRRCLYPTHASYHYYGGRGIRPCDDWIETNPQGFQNFIRDMGPAPTPQHTLERLDPFVGYAPYKLAADGSTVRQCVWATPTEQANNKRAHHIAKAKQAAYAEHLKNLKAKEGTK